MAFLIVVATIIVGMINGVIVVKIAEHILNVICDSKDIEDELLED